MYTKSTALISLESRNIYIYFNKLPAVNYLPLQQFDPFHDGRPGGRDSLGNI